MHNRRAIEVESGYNPNASGRGQWKDDRFIHKIL